MCWYPTPASCGAAAREKPDSKSGNKPKLKGALFRPWSPQAPPHSVHLIGLDLKRKLGMPWLADFRDLWREMDYLEDFLPTERTKRRHTAMEQAVVQHADRITVPTPGVGLSLQNQNEARQQKIKLIHNGWDPGDIQRVPDGNGNGAGQRSQTHERFHLGHFGSLFPTRDIPGLWTAIRRWNACIPEGRKPIHLDLVGNINAGVRDSITSTLLDSDWTDHGYMAHGDAIDKMMDMDALLLVQNNNQTGQWAIPGKAFEYLATGIPIGIVCPIDDLPLR